MTSNNHNFVFKKNFGKRLKPSEDTKGSIANGHKGVSTVSLSDNNTASPRPSEKSEKSASLRPKSASSSQPTQKSLNRDNSLATSINSGSSSKTVTSAQQQLSQLLSGEDAEERRPSKTTVSEEQLMGLHLPHDQETEDREKEMIKKILGPPRPVI
uniref:Uncharacterized protein n=1 Tax=Ditylenchus dipsaci TaxID=166011 RepID=A0A915EGZ5_9BILA